MLNIGANVYLRAVPGPILKTLNSGKKPTPSSSEGNQLSDYVKKVCSKWPETGKNLHQKFFTYRPMFNIGANVYLRAVPY
jgi:hypothetical protein